jgi:hypothetical protein
MRFEQVLLVAAMILLSRSIPDVWCAALGWMCFGAGIAVWIGRSA